MKYINNDYIYCGNFFPVKQIINDVKEGKQRKIAFLGASVTFGQGVETGNDFVSVFTEKWKSHMDTDYLPEIINASTSGTLSGNALFSMDSLVKEKPDLVFLDYSVNDTGDTYLAETFEALVYRFLSAGCAVAVLVFCNNQGHSARGAMTRICRHYQVPIIDIGKIVMDQIAEGELSWDDFALDYVHPNNYGHEYIADNLLQFFSIAENSDHDCASDLPEEPCFAGVFRDVKFIENIECRKEGVQYEEEFSALLIEFTQKPNEELSCAADVYIDDVFAITVELYSDFSWDNRVVKLVCEGYENSRHNIKIMPAENYTCSKEQWESMNMKLGVGCLPDDYEDDE